jgi:Acetyltransferase (GNAT) domain
MMPCACLEDYERCIGPARDRFAGSPAVRTLLARADAPFFHAFLLYFCSLGVRMTEPVEGWIRRAAQKCAAMGLASIAPVLARHAQAESGHHLMMISDTRALAGLWNRNYRPTIDAQALLAQMPTPGVAKYCKVHEDNLAGATPFAQIAIEYEIEMLPLRFGAAFLTRCAEMLGPDIVACLSFISSHTELDVAHTKTNAWALAEICRELPGSVPALAPAGAAVLAAYSQYLDDCISLAERHCRNARAVDAPAISAPVLNFSFRSPPVELGGGDERRCPPWLAEVRALRASVLFDSGRRPAFRGKDGILRDDDPADLHSHHVLAYDGALLVGCLRAHHLADGMQCMTETVVGERPFATLLRSLGHERAHAVELGRWIVHPSYRDGGRLALRLAAAATALTIRLGHGAVARHGIVICSVGTVDRQDLMLRRIGMLNAPVKPIVCKQYDDRLQVMYCNDLRKLDGRFRALMDEMAQLTRLLGDAAEPGAGQPDCLQLS